MKILLKIGKAFTARMVKQNKLPIDLKNEYFQYFSDIEELTKKTGSFKRFSTFVAMLKAALKQVPTRYTKYLFSCIAFYKTTCNRTFSRQIIP